MPTSVTMPQLGESVTEGTVTRWLKQEGEQVQADEPLLEVSTDKVDTEIPSPASGVLQKIVVAEDETVPVGAELAIIAESGQSPETVGSSTQPDTAQPETAQPETAQPETAQPETAQPETAQPETAQPAAQPEQAQSAQSAPAAPQTSAPSSGPPQDASVDQTPAPPAGEVSGQQSPEEPTAPAADTPSPSETRSGDPAEAGSSTGTPVTMPALGESVTEGTVTRWLKSVGDDVDADEPLLEVSTDKVDTEIPAPISGTLLSIAVGEDETVQVGAELAIIAGPEGESKQSPEEGAATLPDANTPIDPDAKPEDVPEAAPEAAEPATAPREEVRSAPDAAPPSDPPPAPAQQKPADLDLPVAPESVPAQLGEPGRSQSEQSRGTMASQQGMTPPADSAAYVTPLVRKLAAEHQVDLSAVTGTGVGGRIRKQDVLDAAGTADTDTGAAETSAPTRPGEVGPSAATPDVKGQTSRLAPSPSAAPGASKRGKTEKLTRLRSLIGRRMLESLQTSAQLTTVVEVDLTLVARLRDRVKGEFLSREGVKLSFLPFFALAAVEALKAHPMVNSSIDSEAGTITYHDSENLGIAVDTDRGLLVPVIHDAGDLNLAGIARKISDLAERTRSNKVLPDELGGGTFTLTNTGSRGALFDTPIINQPQVAIMGTGTVVKRAIVVDDPNLGEIVTVRSMVYLALTYDHRIVDGADAARFLVSVKERLEGGDFDSSLGLS